MQTTIFGAIVLFIIAIYIYDAILTLLGYFDYSIESLFKYKADIHHIYDKLFIVTLLFSLIYILVAAWMQLTLGYTPGLIFK